MNVINGGKHAGNGLAMQEFMILPVGAESYSDAIRIGAEVYQTLKSVLKKKYGWSATNVGDEGGFAPNATNADDALEALLAAIEKSGHSSRVKLGMDVAASEFYEADSKKYNLHFKTKGDTSQMLTSCELSAYYEKLIAKYPIVSIEDPFD